MYNIFLRKSLKFSRRFFVNLEKENPSKEKLQKNLNEDLHVKDSTLSE